MSESAPAALVVAGLRRHKIPFQVPETSGHMLVYVKVDNSVRMPEAYITCTPKTALLTLPDQRQVELHSFEDLLNAAWEWFLESRKVVPHIKPSTVWLPLFIERGWVSPCHEEKDKNV